MSKIRPWAAAVGCALALLIGVAQGHWTAAALFAFVVVPFVWALFTFGDFDPPDPSDGYRSALGFGGGDAIRSIGLRDAERLLNRKDD